MGDLLFVIAIIYEVFRLKGQSTRYTYCALPNCLAEVTIDARDEFGVAKWMIVYDILDELKQQASSAKFSIKISYHLGSS